MKVFKFLCIALLFVHFTACSDDESTPSGDGIVGDWSVTAIDYSGTSTTQVSGYTTSADFVGTGYDMALNISFAENPNEYTTSGDYSILLTTEVNGVSFDSNVTNQGFIGEGTWSESGNMLTVMTDMGDPQTATIVSLEGDVMVLAWDNLTVEEQNGAVVTYDIEGTYTFERQ